MTKPTSSMRLVLLPKEPVLIPVADWLTSCDNCIAQEDGGHYCLLYGTTVLDMDVTTCADWEAKNE